MPNHMVQTGKRQTPPRQGLVDGGRAEGQNPVRGTGQTDIPDAGALVCPFFPRFTIGG